MRGRRNNQKRRRIKELRKSSERVLRTSESFSTLARCVCFEQDKIFASIERSSLKWKNLAYTSFSLSRDNGASGKEGFFLSNADACVVETRDLFYKK